MTINAYAKLNLALCITGKRTDGYHELDTIMQSISLYDTVTISCAKNLSVTMDTGDVPETNNTAYAAAHAFFAHIGQKGGARISIQKRIPQQSGLGGASADAAAVLVGLNSMYDTQLDADTLAALGKSVGADVPFSLFGGTARAKGIGEKLERLHAKTPVAYVVVTPHTGVSTAEAFTRYRPSASVRMDTIAYAIQKGDIGLYHKYAGNALGMAALSIAPDMIAAANALMAAGAEKALMTGSGSSMFAAFETTAKAQAVAENLHGDFALSGVFMPAAAGVNIVEV